MSRAGLGLENRSLFLDAGYVIVWLDLNFPAAAQPKDTSVLIIVPAIIL